MLKTKIEAVARVHLLLSPVSPVLNVSNCADVATADDACFSGSIEKQSFLGAILLPLLLSTATMLNILSMLVVVISTMVQCDLSKQQPQQEDGYCLL